MCLIEKIESADPSAIQGLPLISLTAGLKALGIEIETMWKGAK
jgi:predicted house-cleaning NTP pyrophosphatase (Maf/HAM1 superfamily)